MDKIIVNDWRYFAKVTIETNDLDPMYDVIAGIHDTMPPEFTGRFVMHFLLFYNAGEAYKAAMSNEPFWDYVRDHYPTVKRGTERRHMRGSAGQRAIINLERIHEDPWMVLLEMKKGVTNYTELYENMTTRFAGTQFGPYFIWKLFDIFDVCLRWPIEMTLKEAVKHCPDEPRKCAEALWPGRRFIDVMEHVTGEIEQWDHPIVDRKCGYSEAETILCMMKGFFVTKTHTIGDDILEKHEQLKDSDARQFLPPKIALGYATTFNAKTDQMPW